MQQQLQSLKEEVSDLREQVQTLRAQVAALSELVGLSNEATGSGEAAASVISWESEQAGHTSVPPCNNLSWEEREGICEQIGRFIDHKLRGLLIGDSGRDNIPLKSRFWIVARDFSGRDFNPPRIFDRWNSALGVVKEGNSFGRSVFVGIPSERECKVVVKSAGLRWPLHFER